jgi:hypothetical protein
MSQTSRVATAIGPLTGAWFEPGLPGLWIAFRSLLGPNPQRVLTRPRSVRAAALPACSSTVQGPSPKRVLMRPRSVRAAALPACSSTVQGPSPQRVLMRPPRCELLPCQPAVQQFNSSRSQSSASPDEAPLGASCCPSGLQFNS